MLIKTAKSYTALLKKKADLTMKENAFFSYVAKYITIVDLSFSQHAVSLILILTSDFDPRHFHF